MKKRDGLESDLAELHSGSRKPRGTKNYEKFLERPGRLQERYAVVNRHYDIAVTKATDGKACAVTWKRNATIETHGARVQNFAHQPHGVER